MQKVICSANDGKHSCRWLLQIFTFMSAWMPLNADKNQSTSTCTNNLHKHLCQCESSLGIVLRQNVFSACVTCALFVHLMKFGKYCMFLLFCGQVWTVVDLAQSLMVLYHRTTTSLICCLLAQPLLQHMYVLVVVVVVIVVYKFFKRLYLGC